MTDIEKSVQMYVDADSFDTCLNCTFYPGCGSYMCFAP